LTIAAPCILLPLPIILGGSVNQKSKTRPIFITLGFVMSFASLALLINFLVQKIGLDPNTLRTVAVVMLLLFAGFMIWPTPFERLMSHLSGLINKAGQTGQAVGSGNLGGFILGVIVGIIWAPCAGPILGSILTLVALQQDLGQASLLLIAYAVGAGIPMLAIAYGGQVLTTKVKSIAKYSHRLQQIFGVILVLLAFAIYFQYDTVIQAKLVERFPGIGTSFEKNLIDTFENTPAPDKKESSEQIKLKNLGQAPEFTGISQWLNSEPLKMEALKGKVVLVDFWTYSCINCIRTFPYINQWHEKYKDQGLVIVGVHTPEFAFEKDSENVKTALARHDIKYPVAQDNDYQTWQAYSNRYWPAKYLVDQEGNIVYTHFGEGDYEETENVIRQLLGMDMMEIGSDSQRTQKVGSPEMYFGTDRQANLVPSQKSSSIETVYSLPSKLPLNTFALEGTWKFDSDYAILSKGAGKIKLSFYSGKVFMVASSNNGPITIKTIIDGTSGPEIVVEGSELYTLFDSEEYENHIIEIQIPKSGLQAFTFTFG
jgi:cytochrome c biogenesis protein CcdA/thiol-disulfide isomerase/thioredoxin